MKHLVIFATLIISINSFAMKDQKLASAKIKAFEIIKTLKPYFSDNFININEVEAGKNGFEGSAVNTLLCKNIKNVNLPNGQKAEGIKCRVGLSSGLNITFDSKLNPIQITYFAP